MPKALHKAETYLSDLIHTDDFSGRDLGDLLEKFGCIFALEEDLGIRFTGFAMVSTNTCNASKNVSSSSEIALVVIDFSACTCIISIINLLRREDIMKYVPGIIVLLRHQL